MTRSTSPSASVPTTYTAARSRRFTYFTAWSGRADRCSSAVAVGLTPDALPDLAGLVDLALTAGFRPLFVQTANRDEWEQFESGYLADLERWLHRYGDRREADPIRARAGKHRNEWLRGYRQTLGFAYLHLGRH